MFLGNLSLNEGKISVGLPVLILEFWWRHVKTKNYVISDLIFQKVATEIKTLSLLIFVCFSAFPNWISGQ